MGSIRLSAAVTRVATSLRKTRHAARLAGKAAVRLAHLNLSTGQAGEDAGERNCPGTRCPFAPSFWWLQSTFFAPCGSTKSAEVSSASSLDAADHSGSNPRKLAPPDPSPDSPSGTFSSTRQTLPFPWAFFPGSHRNRRHVKAPKPNSTSPRAVVPMADQD